MQKVLSGTAKYVGNDVEVTLDLESKNCVTGNLPGGKNVLILFDSGATKSIISAPFVRKSHYLSSLASKKVKLVHFKLGNGNFLTASHTIEFEIRIQGHLFKLSALIADNLVGLDLILGNNTLRELGGVMNFAESCFQIRPKRVYFRPVFNVTVYPGQTRRIPLHGRVPSFLRNSEVCVKM